MDPTYWLEDDQLLRFFHRHKTEMSCMEKPQTFLTQLRDHDLVPEERYKKVSRMKSKDNLKKGIYEILDWLERERSRDIKKFWRSIFTDTMLTLYPTLRLLRKSLVDDELPERVEKEESDGGKRKELSEDEEGEEKQANSVRKKRKLRNRSVCYDETEQTEQAGPSLLLTPKQKSKKVCFSSPLKKGEENNIWTWPMFKLQLPVTCGDQKGMLDRQRLAKGEQCIVVGKRWFTPDEFESLTGTKSPKNWKLSIRCRDTTLGKLIQNGHLKAALYKGGVETAKKSLFPSGLVTAVSDGDEDEDEDRDQDEEDLGSSSSKDNSTGVTEEEEEEEEQTEQQPEGSHDSGKVFSVTCGAITAILHKKRFASGTRGKSIRTEMSWMTPMEFMKEASRPPESHWRKDIMCDGESLGDLIAANTLRIHSLLCTCRLCKPDSEDLEHQKNDDECYVCKSADEEELVMCDHCPRSFHQKCHLPHLEDIMLRDGRLWMCTFCVFGQMTEYSYRDELQRDVAMSRQLSQCMLQCQYLLLYLCRADGEQIFATNPCLYLENYSNVIATPMWLGNIAEKLQKQLYQTVGQFVADVQLIFTNCASYNRDNVTFFAMGNKLMELFDSKFKSVFNINE